MSLKKGASIPGIFEVGEILREGYMWNGKTVLSLSAK